MAIIIGLDHCHHVMPFIKKWAPNIQSKVSTTLAVYINLLLKFRVKISFYVWLFNWFRLVIFFFGFTAQNKQDKSSLSYNDAYSPVAALDHENPPFRPGFFVLKVHINETTIAKFPRTVRLGMCLPSACSLADVGRMALLADDPVASHHSIEIISIRSPTENDYVFWKDRTFIILV